jgi:hypothetical protein
LVATSMLGKAGIGARGFSTQGTFFGFAMLCQTVTEGGQLWRSSKFACPTYRVNRRLKSSSQN